MSARSKLSELVKKKQQVDTILENIKDIETCLKNRKDFSIDKLKDINETFGLNISFSSHKKKEKLCEEVIAGLKQKTKSLDTEKEKKEEVKPKTSEKEISKPKTPEKVVSSNIDKLKEIYDELKNAKCDARGGDWTLDRLKKLDTELRSKFKLKYSIKSNLKKQEFCEALKNVLKDALKESKKEVQPVEVIEEKVEKVKSKEDVKPSKVKKVEDDVSPLEYLEELYIELKDFDCSAKGGKWTLDKLKTLYNELKKENILNYYASPKLNKNDFCELLKTEIKKKINELKVEKIEKAEQIIEPLIEKQVEKVITQEELKRNQIIYILEDIIKKFRNGRKSNLKMDLSISIDEELERLEKLKENVEKFEFTDALDYIEKYKNFVNDNMIRYIYNIINNIDREKSLADLRYFTYKYINIFNSTKLNEEDTAEFLIKLFNLIINSDKVFKFKDITYETFCRDLSGNEFIRENENKVIEETVYTLPMITEDNKPIASIQESFDILKEEILTEVKKCEEVSKGSLFIKKHRFELNDYAIFRLNRFSADGTKNISPILINYELNNDNKMYELIGVINHLGSTIKRGHYNAYIKNTDKWYICDDDDVNEVNPDDMNKMGTNPYVILYKRKDKSHNVPNKPFGLENVTTTACYMNSALQLLFNTEFYNFINSKGQNLQMVQEDIKKYEIKLEREREKELEREREKELEREKEKELEREKEKEIIKPIVIPVKVKYDADLDYFQKVINNIRKLKETTKLEEAINKIDDKILSCIGLAV